MHVRASAQQLALLRSCTGHREIALSKDEGGPAEMVVQPTRHMRISGACAPWHAFLGTSLQLFASGSLCSRMLAIPGRSYGRKETWTGYAV